MDTNQDSTVINNPNNKNGKGVVTTVVIIIILAIIFLVWKSMSKTPDTTNSPASLAGDTTNTNTENPTTQSSTTTTTTTTDVSASATATAAKTVKVSLTDTGYSPASVTINAGDTVLFTNNSSGKMWTASDPHPQHTDYPGFDEKSAANNGGSYSFTFTKVGSWGYHNHLNPRIKGTVIVK